MTIGQAVGSNPTSSNDRLTANGGAASLREAADAMLIH